MTTTTTATRPASPAQIAFITGLRRERVLSDAHLARLDAALAAGMGSQQASASIKWLQAQPVKAVAAPRVEVAEGMWIVGTVEDGRVFRVMEGRDSGHLYVKELVDGSFVYVQGAMGVIARQARQMTIEEAAEFGHLFHFCCVCGRELTAVDSIAAGIGPICASKF